MGYVYCRESSMILQKAVLKVSLKIRDQRLKEIEAEIERLQAKSAHYFCLNARECKQELFPLIHIGTGACRALSGTYLGDAEYAAQELANLTRKQVKFVFNEATYVIRPERIKKVRLINPTKRKSNAKNS